VTLDEQITLLQQRFGPTPKTPRTRLDFLRIARWWLLESKRGYPSSDRSRWYAENTRARADALDQRADSGRG
jgi:hypothetical protein